MKQKEIVTDRIAVQKDLVALSKIFNDAGFSLYLVGGALRDMYLRRENYDIDVATDAKPQDVIKLFRNTIPTGIKHGTVTIRFRGHSIECTTMRRDVGYTDSRHPDSVEYGTSIVEDLSRRDFCMNAIAASLPDGNIIDPYNGRKDIDSKIIRAVGDPIMRFSEDGLRPMRAIRFASQLGFAIEEETLQAIPLSLERMKSVSIERFQDEFNKMLKGEYFSIAMFLMKNTGVLHLFIPSLDTLDEKELHQMVYAISFIPKTAIALRLSLIFYWVYKKSNETNKKAIEVILKALKYPNKTVAEVLHFIQFCNFELESINNNEVNIRKFLKNIGRENIHNIFMLKKAIALSEIANYAIPSAKKTSLSISDIEERVSIREDSPVNEEQRRVSDFVENVERQVQAVLEENPPLSIKELAINGEDLLKIGILKGEQIGKILNKLVDIVVEKPQMNNKEELMEQAREINERTCN